MAYLTDLTLLWLRLMVAVIFVASGYNDLKDPDGRSRSIGVSKTITILLGIAEIAGGLGLAFGVLTQLAALGLVLIMLGAIFKKIFVWHTGFWGEEVSGWHYDLMITTMCFVIIATNGGRWVLMK